MDGYIFPGFKHIPECMHARFLFVTGFGLEVEYISVFQTFHFQECPPILSDSDKQS